MPRKDKEREREIRRQHYLDNRQKLLDAAARRRRERSKDEVLDGRIYARRYQARHRKQMQLFLKELKESLPCSDCERFYPHYVMDFDHIRGKKLFQLSKASSWNLKWDAIKAEIMKCDLVCANCHRIRTHQVKQRDVNIGRIDKMFSGLPDLDPRIGLKAERKAILKSIQPELF